MRLVLIDETDAKAPPSPLAADIARRAAVAEAAFSPVAADERAGAAAAAALAAADAAVVACASDPAARALALRWVDAHLPRHAPALICCHATAATPAAAALATRERFVGFALLPPSETRSAVECALPPWADPAAADAAAAVWRALGLEPAWVGDRAGLVTPRIVAALANEAAFAVMEGAASADDVDRAMRLGVRYPRGPLAWADRIGLRDVVATLDALAAESGPERYRAAPLLRRKAAAGERWFPREETA